MQRRGWMQALQNLTYLTQCGLSVAAPPVLCLLGGLWLQRHYGLGVWVILVALLLGIGAGACSFVSFLQMVRRRTQKNDRHESDNQHEDTTRR